MGCIRNGCHLPGRVTSSESSQGNIMRPIRPYRWDKAQGGILATEGELLEWTIVTLQISIRESGGVTILDLQGRATIGVDSDLLSSHLQRLVAAAARKLLV